MEQYQPPDSEPLHAVQPDPHRTETSSLRTERPPAEIQTVPETKLRHEPEPEVKLAEQSSGKPRLRFEDEEKGKTPEARKTVKKKTTGKPNPKSGKQRKSRLNFTKEELPVPVKAVKNAAVVTGVSAVNSKIEEAEQDNTAVEAVHKSALTTTGTARIVHHVSNRRKIQRSYATSEKSRKLIHDEEKSSAITFDKPKTSKNNANPEKEKHFKEFVKRQRKKKQIREGYQAAKDGAQTFGTASEAVTSALKKVLEVICEKRHTITILLSMLFFVLFFMTQLVSCGAVVAGAVDAFLETTWLSDDEDINKADLYYTKLEADLARKIGRSSSNHPGYDEYRFELDDIGHNPVELISYLSAEAENGVFEYNSALEHKLNELFEKQYSLTYDENSESSSTTKTVRVGESIGQVVTSAYCNCALCCGEWAGSPTESGVMPTANHTLAVDLYDPIVPIGTKIVMNGILYTVEDTGYLNRYGVNFDIYMDSHAVAELWGHKTFEAYLYDANGSDSVIVTDTSSKKICTVKLKRKSFDELVRHDLNLIQQEQYNLYNQSGGNRAFIGSPVDGDWTEAVSGYYGYRCNPSNAVAQHNDIAISQPAGTRVHAPFEGVVAQIGTNSTLGNYVTVKKDGYAVTYGHLQSVSVTTGQEITKGGIIGRVGSTGNVTEPTLSILFQYNGTTYNPYFYLQNGTN